MTAISPIHMMELPRKILIGDGVFNELGKFVKSIDKNSLNIIFITGKNVKLMTERNAKNAMKDFSIRDHWYIRSDSSIESVCKLKNTINSKKPDMIIGLGGGKSVDIAKMIAHELDKPFISIPTSASHDGIASPFVSLKGTSKPHSIKANTPIGIIADTILLSEAPPRLLSSGCGDLVAKITAVKDWELSKEENQEYFGTYSANLAQMSANIIVDKSEILFRDLKIGIRIVIEALISAGVAACIAGSSRPCSGAEHLFSHALEYLNDNVGGLHGERVGIGTIIMAKLHDLDWELIVRTLKNVNAPTSASEINISEKNMVDALLIAKKLRPERYTILNKTKLNRDLAYKLLKTVKVI